MPTLQILKIYLYTKLTLTMCLKTLNSGKTLKTFISELITDTSKDIIKVKICTKQEGKYKTEAFHTIIQKYLSNMTDHSRYTEI